MPPLFWDLPLGVSFHVAHLVSRSNFKPGALFAVDLMSGVFVLSWLAMSIVIPLSKHEMPLLLRGE